MQGVTSSNIAPLDLFSILLLFYTTGTVVDIRQVCKPIFPQSKIDREMQLPVFFFFDCLFVFGGSL